MRQKHADKCISGYTTAPCSARGVRPVLVFSTGRGRALTACPEFLAQVRATGSKCSAQLWHRESVNHPRGGWVCFFHPIRTVTL